MPFSSNSVVVVLLVARGDREPSGERSVQLELVSIDLSFNMTSSIGNCDVTRVIDSDGDVTFPFTFTKRLSSLLSNESSRF